MDVIQTAEEMQQRALQLKSEGLRIGFVPTMGFLHEGHLSLIRLARAQSDVVVVSIFVNPSQFGPQEDLDRYPRDFQRDEALCRAEQVDVVFYPDTKEMYASDASIWLVEESLSSVLCGASRPGHFRGVCTVVAKLFNLIQPEVAVFGEKDAQQLRIIERLVRDLHWPIRIVRGAIVREEDGLAMSSRNRYLSSEDRIHARSLYRALSKVEEMCKAGQYQTVALLEALQQIVDAEEHIELEYAVIVDDATLVPVDQVESNALVALAARCGEVRLIDNITLRPDRP